MRKICAYCKKEYSANERKDLLKRQKYCSAFCREKAWHKAHPDKCKQFQKKYRLSKPVLCRGCKKPIPTAIRASGKIYCSEKCHKVISLQAARDRRQKAQTAFNKYKISIGCQQCGYYSYGGSLDFHHRKPNDKKRRIAATTWVYHTKAIKEEIAKCILLCKNCHYETHGKNEDKKIEGSGSVHG